MTLAAVAGLQDTGEAALVAWLLLLPVPPSPSAAEALVQIRTRLRAEDFVGPSAEVYRWRLAQLERQPGDLDALLQRMRHNGRVDLSLLTERLARTPTWSADDPGQALEAARAILRRSVHRGLVALCTARLHGLRGAPCTLGPARTPAAQVLESARAAELELLARLG